MNKILKSTFFHATFCIMEIRHCPWKAVTVLTIRRNQRELCCEIEKKTQTDLQTSHWNSLTQIHLTGSTGLQIKYQIQSYDGTIPWPPPVLMFCVTLLTSSQYASKIISSCFKVVQFENVNNLREPSKSVLSSRLWGPCIIIPELWLLQINKTICWHDQVAGARSGMGQ